MLIEDRLQARVGQVKLVYGMALADRPVVEPGSGQGRLACGRSGGA